VRAYLDALIERQRTPGLQYSAVAQSGQLLTYAAGWSDLGSEAPMRITTVLPAYSMSKTITAAAVLKLAAAGLVELDVPLKRYVDVPYGPGVTVRRLLSHTAGLRNPLPLRWVHRVSEHATFDERAALATVLERHGTLAARPGARYRYSNLGYWLLGSVVEQAAGCTFGSYVEREILRPLGIGADQLGYTIENPEQLASGYLEKWSALNLLKRFVIDGAYIDGYAGRWLRILPHYPNGPAFGGLVGNADGFAAFLLDQLQPASTVLPAAARAWLYERQRLDTATPIAMTLGWHVGDLNGQTYYFKEGGGGGFHSLMRLYPERGLGSVLLTNATRFEVRRTLDEVDRLLG
jgi:CubicO group peptidase (beta-lactamase class C family)